MSIYLFFMAIPFGLGLFYIINVKHDKKYELFWCFFLKIKRGNIVFDRKKTRKQII